MLFRSNEHSTIALREGSLDASMSFVPRIWHKKISGVNTWFEKPPYFVPGAMPMLIINTTKAPLDNKLFRRAIATSIDYVAIRMFAVSNYTSEIISGLIMPTSLEKEFVNKEDCDKYGIDFSLVGEYKIKAVQTMIQQAGYKSVFNKDGSLSHMENNKGEKMPTLFITCPASGRFCKS